MSLGLTRRGGGMAGERGIAAAVGLTLLCIQGERGEKGERGEQVPCQGGALRQAWLEPVLAGPASRFLSFYRAEMAFPASLDHLALLAPR